MHESWKAFFQNGLVYVLAFGKFFFSFTKMLYCSPLFGGIGLLPGIFTIRVILKFDKSFIESAY